MLNTNSSGEQVFVVIENSRSPRDPSIKALLFSHIAYPLRLPYHLQVSTPKRTTATQITCNQAQISPLSSSCQRKQILSSCFLLPHTSSPLTTAPADSAVLSDVKWQVAQNTRPPEQEQVLKKYKQHISGTCAQTTGVCVTAVMQLLTLTLRRLKRHLLCIPLLLLLRHQQRG
jgi:hypothetical protein